MNGHVAAFLSLPIEEQTSIFMYYVLRPELENLGELKWLVDEVLSDTGPIDFPEAALLKIAERNPGRAVRREEEKAGWWWKK